MLPATFRMCSSRAYVHAFLILEFCTSDFLGTWSILYDDALGAPDLLMTGTGWYISFVILQQQPVELWKDFCLNLVIIGVCWEPKTLGNGISGGRSTQISNVFNVWCARPQRLKLERSIGRLSDRILARIVFDRTISLTFEATMLLPPLSMQCYIFGFDAISIHHVPPLNSIPTKNLNNLGNPNIYFFHKSAESLGHVWWNHMFSTAVEYTLTLPIGVLWTRYTTPLRPIPIISETTFTMSLRH